MGAPVSVVLPDGILSIMNHLLVYLKAYAKVISYN